MTSLAQTLARIAGWIGVAIIVVLSVVPGDERPHTGFQGRYEHVVAYAMVCAALTFGYRDQRIRLGCLTGLVFLACAMELVQLGVPGRTAAIGDAVAGALGALIGMMAAGWATREGRAH